MSFKSFWRNSDVAFVLKMILAALVIVVRENKLRRVPGGLFAWARICFLWTESLLRWMCHIFSRIQGSIKSETVMCTPTAPTGRPTGTISG